MSDARPLLSRIALTAAALACVAAAYGESAPAAGAPSLAELPHWPIGMPLPPGIDAGKPPKGPPKAEVMAWVPPGATGFRALLIVPNNTDSKGFAEHAALREVATRREMAIVYIRRTVHYSMKDAVDLTATQRVLDALAEKTGISCFRHAPWIPFGKSSTGQHPYFQAWAFPRRTIATITYQGETPPWPPASWAKLDGETIPHVNVNGETEWMGTWYRHVRPHLLNYRAHSAWLPHQVVAAGVGHGDYADAHGSPGWGKPVAPGVVSVLRVWDYLARYVDKALALRLPAEGHPVDGPLELRRIDPATGVLVHPRAIEELLAVRWRPLRRADGLFQIVDHVKEPQEVYEEQQGTVDPAHLIRAATEVPEAERAGYLWIADRELADAWLALMTTRRAAPAAP